MDYAKTAGIADIDSLLIAKQLENYQLYLTNVRITCQTGIKLDKYITNLYYGISKQTGHIV